MPTKTIHNIRPYREAMAAFDRASLLSTPGAPSRQCLAVVSGAFGAGKSFCANEFIEANPHHIMVVCPEKAFGRSKGPFLSLLGERVGVAVEGQRDLYAARNAIIKALHDRGGMVILDECEELTTENAKLFQRMVSEAGVVGCFVGAPKVKATLLRHEALSTRVGFRIDLQGVTVDDLQVMFPATFSHAVYEEIVTITRGNIANVIGLWNKLHELKRYLSAEGLGPILPAHVHDTANETMLLRAA